MNNKKILVSFLLVVLIALSVGAVSAEDNATDVLADDPITVQPESTAVADVQAAVDSAKNPGDTVDLSNNAEYDFVDQTVNIQNDGIIVDGKGTTTIKGYGDGNGIFAIKAQNVTIQGFKFIDTNPKNDFKYNGTVAGWGISANPANGGVIRDCEFTDFNSAIAVMGTTGFTIENCKFTGGYSTKLANDPTVNKEQGSKALNIYKGSSQVVVKNNTFTGPMLDGVSIAQGSGFNKVIGNTFEGNCYSIYFGGASTTGSVIADNTFINCGFFKEGDIFWEGLPVVSIQKSSDNITITDNTFKAINNNILIAAEGGNEAHGAPTVIGNITITGNTVEKYDDAAKSITLFHVLARDSSSLQVSAPLTVTGNVLANDVKGISIIFDDREIFTASNAIINDTLDANKVFSNETLFGTTLTVSDLKVYAGDKGILKLTLKDSNGIGLANKEIFVVVGDNPILAFTNDDGVVEIPITEAAATTKFVTAAFLGEGNVYKGSIDTAKITVNKKSTALTASKATLKVKKVKKITVTLKSNKKAVAGKKITIKVNGKTFSAKTNKNGKATIKVKVTKKGSFKATVSFAGDGAYKAVKKTVTYKVKK